MVPRSKLREAYDNKERRVQQYHSATAQKQLFL